MEINEFKKYTKDLDSYSASDVEQMEFMTNEELDNYQIELERDSGNLSEWDHCRAVISFRKRINEWEEYANLVIHSRNHWEGEYNKAYAKYLKSHAELEDLIYIEKEYGQLVNENAYLLHFKETVEKVLSKEQLEEIEEEMQNIQDVDY